MGGFADGDGEDVVLHTGIARLAVLMPRPLLYAQLILWSAPSTTRLATMPKCAE